MDPNERMTGQEALSHPYFDGLREHNVTRPGVNVENSKQHLEAGVNKIQTIQNTNIGGTISSISQTPLTHGTSTNFYNGTN